MGKSRYVVDAISISRHCFAHSLKVQEVLTWFLFWSRTELTSWVSELLDLNISKVEECGKGYVRSMPFAIRIVALSHSHSHVVELDADANGF